MYSSIIRVTDIDDYIAPSQECVKPVVIEKLKNAQEIVIKKKKSSGNQQQQQQKDYEPVQITLNDCLACSGCITTAEALLVEAQSNHVLVKLLADIKTARNHNDSQSNPPILVASISLQSISSLSLKHNLGSVAQSYQTIARFFRFIGIDHVMDLSLAGDLALIKSAHEFVALYLEHEQKEPQSVTQDFPLITGACPGFVCYAEKHKDNEQIVRHVSRIRSAQQIMGALIKRRRIFQREEHQKEEEMASLKEAKEKERRQIYHICVAPCFDKKLEASRREFSFPANTQHTNDTQNNENKDEDTVEEKEVDLVLATNEVDNLIAQYSEEFNQAVLQSAPTDVRENREESKEEPHICSQSEAGSGAYLQFVFRFAAKRLFRISLAADLRRDARVRFPKRAGNNRDFFEIHLVASNDEILLRFAIAYGFRNIQTVLRKLNATTTIKTPTNQKMPPIHFVEMMACPRGCLNGGGQIQGSVSSSLSSSSVSTSSAASSASSSNSRSNRQSEQIAAHFHSAAISTPYANPITREILARFSKTENDNKNDDTIWTTRLNVIKPSDDLLSRSNVKW